MILLWPDQTAAKHRSPSMAVGFRSCLRGNAVLLRERALVWIIFYERVHGLSLWVWTRGLPCSGGDNIEALNTTAF
uniref:Uncharacterized protein n=1 Tax=Candidatus Kentrum sp. LFY TaxID=2126342 RepID=A0A450WTG9_9GAMM|nr:MAG: hypothetical protein BECKLFY1418C_GA0070996_107114 [Candidatus Kentron sp. LFY]